MIPENAIFVCRTGSKLFCRSDKDDDFIVVAESPCDYRYLHTPKLCLFCYSPKEFEKLAAMRLNDFRDIYVVALLLAKENTVKGKMPSPLPSLSQCLQKLPQAVLRAGKNGFFDKRTVNAVAPDCCKKGMIWALAAYFMIKNNATQFTPQQREIMQRCHDNCLPLSYRDELLATFDALAKAAPLRNRRCFQSAEGGKRENTLHTSPAPSAKIGRAHV